MRIPAMLVALAGLAACVAPDTPESRAAQDAALEACLGELGKPMTREPGAAVVIDASAGPGDGVPATTVRLTPAEFRQFDACMDARRG